ncbi:MAG: hypothetical protein HC877_22350 [Thioploca sp.]|nr:hypothetical protein [Thioploca sp.]
MGKPRPKKSEAPENFPQKLWDKLPQNWRDGAQAKSTQDIKEDLIKSEQAILQVENDMADDEKNHRH